MKIEVLGIYQTKFAELWEKSLKDLIAEASLGALKDAGISPDSLDAVFIGNMLSSKVADQGHLGALVNEILGINVPATRIEAACASGGLAVSNAINAILSGLYKTVLVIGAEKMTDLSPGEITSSLMEAGSAEKEGRYGLTFPSLYALMARAYMEKYNLTEKDLALVSVKNHYHASLNNLAQFPFEVTVDQVLKSPCVSDPLKLLDCSPISDGAAAIVIANSKYKIENKQSLIFPRPELLGVNSRSELGTKARKLENKQSLISLRLRRIEKRKKKKVYIVGSSVATDTVVLQDREDFTSLKATKLATQKVYQMAGVKPKDLDLAEVHDCFSIAEILALEDLGFCQKGKAKELLKSGETKLGGKLPINTSGGLKACGHPVGATGVKQICEIVIQLRGEAGKRQVKKAKIGLTHNVGGSGGTAVVHILRNEL